MKPITYVFPAAGSRANHELFNPELFTELCLEVEQTPKDEPAAWLAEKQKIIAAARQADFAAAIAWVADTWTVVDYGTDGPLDPDDPYSVIMPYTVMHLTPQEVLARVLTLCRMAESGGFHLLPPPELTALCL